MGISWVGLGIVVANESECKRSEFRESGNVWHKEWGFQQGQRWEKKLHNVSCPDFRDPHSMNISISEELH
jgi:hypothetical protein